MDDNEFRVAVKQVLVDARVDSLEQTRLILELGDEFGDVDLGGWKDLMRVAGSPGKVLRTALGSVANISNRARTLATVILKGLPTLVVPFIKQRYDRIYQAESQRQREIERMYPEIFALVRDGFPDDGQLFAFMLDPVVMTTANVGSLGVDLTLDLVDALSGNSPDVITKTRPLRRRVSGGTFGKVESQSLRDLLILEEPESRQQEPGTGKRAVWELMNDESFRQTLSQAKPVRDIIDFARGSKNATLNDVIQLGKQLMGAGSIQELEGLGLEFGPKLDQLSQEVQGSDSADVTREILTSAKDYALDLLMKRMQASIEEFSALGVGEDSDLMRVHQKTLQRLEQLRTHSMNRPARPIPTEQPKEPVGTPEH